MEDVTNTLYLILFREDLDKIQIKRLTNQTMSISMCFLSCEYVCKTQRYNVNYIIMIAHYVTLGLSQ